MPRRRGAARVVLRVLLLVVLLLLGRRSSRAAVALGSHEGVGGDGAIPAGDDDHRAPALEAGLVLSPPRDDPQVRLHERVRCRTTLRRLATHVSFFSFLFFLSIARSAPLVAAVEL